ncbi:hypothetical protein CBR_g66652 [Chara braunii]|uniref:Uncharacterized protein n=1 Tax=Chara braunii TaxID=69332 RepID=A0A388JPV1_CHABU|nr:hypothetical protein CBR_g66652 [Chara braunii]|eukprot:GBG59849.1 hypothetical protein CBR_g66652 [Chara braunii]
MQPVYSLLERMDAEGTSPTNLVEYDDLIGRKLTNVMLTRKERDDVMLKVNGRMQMMRQPVHAAAFLLDPMRREPLWLLDIELVQNAMRFFSRQVGGEWDSKKHSDMWGDLWKFHKKPGGNENDCKDERMWRTVATDDESRLSRADWWAAHGGDVPALQSIAVKLLCVPNNKDSGYIDVWGSFFEPNQEPVPDDGSVLLGRVEDAVEEEEEKRRQRTLAKAPRSRIPQNLSDSDLSDSSDLEDLVWKDKCCSEEEVGDSYFELDAVPAVQGTTYVHEEEVGDSDFELDAVPAVQGTTYVGRRLGRGERDLEVEPTSIVNRLDTDVETLLRPMNDADEEEAAGAKAMADKEVDLVKRRMCEEEARCAAVSFLSIPPCDVDKRCGSHGRTLHDITKGLLQFQNLVTLTIDASGWVDSTDSTLQRWLRHPYPSLRHLSISAEFPGDSLQRVLNHIFCSCENLHSLDLWATTESAYANWLELLPALKLGTFIPLPLEHLALTEIEFCSHLPQLDVLPLLFPHLKSLHIWSWHDSPEVILLKILSSLSQLWHLEFFYCSSCGEANVEWQWLRRMIPAKDHPLEELTLSGMELFRSQTELDICFSLFPNLRVLKFPSCTVTSSTASLSFRFPTLERLEIVRMESTTANCYTDLCCAQRLPSIHIECGNLSHLVLDKVSDFAIARAKPGCTPVVEFKMLTDLHPALLEWCQSLSDSFVCSPFTPDHVSSWESKLVHPRILMKWRSQNIVKLDLHMPACSEDWLCSLLTSGLYTVESLCLDIDFLVPSLRFADRSTHNPAAHDSGDSDVTPDVARESMLLGHNSTVHGSEGSDDTPDVARESMLLGRSSVAHGSDGSNVSPDVAGPPPSESNCCLNIAKSETETHRRRLSGEAIVRAEQDGCTGLGFPNLKSLILSSPLMMMLEGGARKMGDEFGKSYRQPCVQNLQIRASPSTTERSRRKESENCSFKDWSSCLFLCPDLQNLTFQKQIYGKGDFKRLVNGDFKAVQPDFYSEKYGDYGKVFGKPSVQQEMEWTESVVRQFVQSSPRLKNVHGLFTGGKRVSCQVKQIAQTLRAVYGGVGFQFTLMEGGTGVSIQQMLAASGPSWQ